MRFHYVSYRTSQKVWDYWQKGAGDAQKIRKWCCDVRVALGAHPTHIHSFTVTSYEIHLKYNHIILQTTT
jgi:cellulase/cellobiase CelA1